jgi:outer membrane receptor protein involved in Fe transport
MGGVVQLLSPEPWDEDAERAGARLFGGWNSADDGRTLRAEGATQGERAALAGGATWQSYSDRRVGGGDKIANSEWESRAADLRLGLRQGTAADWLFAVQWLEQPSTPRVDELVPGYGQDTPPSEVYQFEPNARGFLHARYRRSTELPWIGDLEVHLARQVITDDRVTQDYGASIRNSEENESTLDGLTAQFVSTLAADWTLAWGLEFYRDTVRSARQATDVDTGSGIAVRPRFPDHSSMDSDAVFATVGWKPVSTLEIDAGLRYSAFDIALPAEVDVNAVALSPEDLTGDLRALLDLGDGWRLVANVSRGFRPPNVFDLGTLGPRPGNRYNVANPNLGPETVWSYDAGLKFASDTLQAELFGFYLDYRDRITSVPTGEITPDGRVVVRSENRAEVRLYGFEGGLRWRSADSLDLFAVLNWTEGEEVNEFGPDTPADRIPPINGQLGLVWRPRERLDGEPFLQFAARQDRLSLRDITDPRINPEGTPGWVTLNLHLLWRLDERYTLGLNLDNLTDENYREHGSGIDARGHNLGLWLDARF